MPEQSLWTIFINASLVNNFVLAYFLGICPFLGVSSKIETASRMGGAVTFVMLVSSVCAFDVRSFGTAGLLAIPEKNDAVSADIRTAPASAVPSEIPRFENVFWRPPTSPLCSIAASTTAGGPTARAPRPTASRSSPRGTTGSNAIICRSRSGRRSRKAIRCRRRSRRRSPTWRR